MKVQDQAAGSAGQMMLADGRAPDKEGFHFFLAM